MKVRITINEVTEWSEDNTSIRGDISHEDERYVRERIEDEREAKEESDNWQNENLPLSFVREITSLASEEDILSKLVEEYALERVSDICKNDYLQPLGVDCDYEIIDDEQSVIGKIKSIIESDELSSDGMVSEIGDILNDYYRE